MFKYTTKLLALLFVFACLTMFIGCQDQQPVATDTNQINLSKELSFILPSGATIASAKFFIYQEYGPVGQAINVHRITSDWMECDLNGVTWGNFGGAYDGSVVNSFTASTNSWRSVDITLLVKAWMEGTYPNYGLLLDDPSQLGRSKFYSRENSANQPYLEIVLSTGATIQVEPFADNTIWEISPNSNNCGEEYNWTGYTNDPVLGLEKQALIKFDIVPTPPSGGCTLTSGYWKTHSEFGPAPYNDTWAQLPNGASTTFFLSGKTYYQVLWTPAFMGNSYYILAHAI